MTEVRDQKSEVENQKGEIISQNAGRAERFLYALYARLAKPISDLRLPMSGLCASLFALGVSAQAQEPGKVYRIGFLSTRPAIQAREEAFRQGLREIGYREGQNIVIEWRFTKGKASRFPEFATELVGLKVDVIVAGGSEATFAAKNATRTLPIVFPTASDPVGLGLWQVSHALEETSRA
jgi:ABC-type uncharacterized transport system substrate-binding protein